MSPVRLLLLLLLLLLLQQGNNAVIGLPGQPVQVYNLQGQVPSRVIPALVQDLKNATIVIENGVTTMDFTRPLKSNAAKEVKKNVPQYHIFAYAAGKSSLVQHSNYGTVTLNLAECQVIKKKGLTSIEKHALLMAVGELSHLHACMRVCNAQCVYC
jgi:predicted transcriptional regulator